MLPSREVKIIILRGCLIGNQEASPGEVWSVSRMEAAMLCENNFLAKLVDAKAAPYTVTVETPQHGDPAPRRISGAAPVVTEKEKAAAKT